MALLRGAPPTVAVLYECGRGRQFFAARIVLRRVRLGDQPDDLLDDLDGLPQRRGPRNVFGRPWLGSARAARSIHGC